MLKLNSLLLVVFVCLFSVKAGYTQTPYWGYAQVVGILSQGGGDSIKICIKAGDFYNNNNQVKSTYWSNNANNFLLVVKNSRWTATGVNRILALALTAYTNGSQMVLQFMSNPNDQINTNTGNSSGEILDIRLGK